MGVNNEIKEQKLIESPTELKQLGGKGGESGFSSIVKSWIQDLNQIKWHVLTGDWNTL